MRPKVTAPSAIGHALWVRTTHWVVTLSVFVLAFTGVEILMVHPRLYWGEVGNDLTPPLLELPISRNHRHGGWTTPAAFRDGPDAPVSAGRTFEIFNQNGWGRSLHFLAAWVFVAGGVGYLVAGALAGHFRRHVMPRASHLTAAHLRREVSEHMRLRVPPAAGGPAYGALQRVTYTAMVFVTLPLTVLTGFTMSPAITAAFPVLLSVFGGHQSARTMHFGAFALTVAFLVVHVLMVVLSGFRRQMRGMTIGGGIR
jgi:thiosulfate reductase cytochrome b subunit